MKDNSIFSQWKEKEQKPAQESQVKNYKKISVEVQAVPWNGNNLEEILAFTGYDTMRQRLVHGDLQIVIPTLEGEMCASIGDYIIKGVEGEFYPCKPAIFKKTYQPTILYSNSEQLTFNDIFDEDDEDNMEEIISKLRAENQKLLSRLKGAIEDLKKTASCNVCGNKNPWCDNPDKCKGWKWRDIPSGVINERSN